MNKKIYILLFFVTLLSFLVGCEKEDNKEQMKINSSELTMNVGDVITLEVSNASGDVIFISSDESVVECNNAQITAISAGVATVTVSDDDESLNCVINVVEVEQKFDGAYVINVEIDFVDLIVGDEYQLAPVLMLGLDVIENVNYKYTSTNESVAKVENGKIKALTVGEAEIQIDAIDYPQTSKIIKVFVRDDFTIDLSESNLTLSRIEVLDYVSSEEIDYIVKDKGVVLDVNELAVSISDENIVSVEQKGDKYVFTALNVGEAKVSFSYKKADGCEAISYVNVSVVKPIIEIASDYYFSKVKGSVDFKQMDFGGINLEINANNCIKVSDNLGNDFPIASKTNGTVVINTTKNITEQGEVKKMYYDMGEFIVSFDIIQCTLAIRTVKDFLSMDELLEEKVADDGNLYKRIDGYIVLVNDLDFAGIEFEPFCGYLQIDKKFAGRSGWNATFEGNNKILKNIKIGSDTIQSKWNSLFGNVGWNGVIRNVAIVDCTFGAKATGAVIADYFHGTISNVFISATINTGFGTEIENTTSGFSIATPYKNASIENVTVVIKNTLPAKYNAVISAGYTQHTTTYTLSGAPIKSMVCIGGGDESKLLVNYKTLNEINKANGSKGYVICYKTIADATNAVIADNGSTSFNLVDDKLQITFNGTIVYNE